MIKTDKKKKKTKKNIICHKTGAAACIDVKCLLDEPVAAAIADTFAYCDNRKAEFEKINLFLDIGGGTTDVSIIKINAVSDQIDDDGTQIFDFQVLAITGNNHLGGQDFTNIIYERCLNQIKNSRKKPLSNKQKNFLFNDCEKAKLMLGRKFSANIMPLVEIDLDDGTTFNTEINKHQFETACSMLISEIEKCIVECVEYAKIQMKQIDEIIKIGGSARLCILDGILEKICKMREVSIPRRVILSPQTAVAAGAAIYGYFEQHEEIQININTVIPMNINVKIASEDGTNEHVASVIVERNTKLPIQRMCRKYWTFCDNQEEIRLEIYEGNHPSTKDEGMILVGEAKLEHLKMAKKGNCYFLYFPIFSITIRI